MSGDNERQIMPLTSIEVQIIAKTVVHEALDQQTKTLPMMLKPLMFDVAEVVAKRGEEGMRVLISGIFGLDLDDHEAVRKFQQDIYWLRAKRLESEAQQRVLKNAMVVGSLKVAWVALIAFIGAVLALMGIKTFF